MNYFITLVPITLFLYNISAYDTHLFKVHELVEHGRHRTEDTSICT